MMTLSEAAAALRVSFAGNDVRFTGVSTDTRTLEPGDLFVALRGERFDGHAFVEAAAGAGAVAAMVDRSGDAVRVDIPKVEVDDTRLALGELARQWRGRFSMPLVALTGSSGKTTAKEMLASILRETRSPDNATTPADSVLATRGNLNNDIGVPLMLLELASHHHYAVIEMGMNHAGEIRYLSHLATPDVAVITNAGRAHIEYLGSEEAIARAKGEIFEGLSDSGTAVINADDRFAPLWRQLAGARRRIEFGLEHPATLSASYRERGFTTELVLKTSGAAIDTTLAAPGLHNVRNALAAAAAALALDVPCSAIAAGLAAYTGTKGRLQAKAARNGATVIDDTYNANPESMRAAVAVLAKCSGYRVLVIGDMGELGERAAEYHAELGRVAKDAGIDRLLALGEASAETARAFGERAHHYSSVEEVIEDAGRTLAEGVTVLVKGSRFMRMERVVDALTRPERLS